ncbi:MAG TPA: hypothetical protein VE226_00870 [Nitrososphaeraceae archaeon]|nr:hypothetical protein [Nitrososphaeraceae archaeon]
MNNNFKTFFRKDSSRNSNNITSTIQLMLHFNEKAQRNPITGYILVSLGVLLSASSGSWDITNHLLNKPETFFSPPHAGLYMGVAIVLSGSIMMLSRYYRSYSNISNNNHYINKLIDLPLPMKLVTIGVIMLVSAGPFDFAWHSAFGLDGLLSPSHSVLTIGMAVSSIGALLGMLSSNNDQNNNDNDNKSRKFNPSITTSSSCSSSAIVDSTNNDDNNTSHAISLILIIIGIIPVWITVSGLIHMASLPFSDTEHFNFNPDPTLAAIIATLAFPFIMSFMLFSSFQLSVRSKRIKRMFGILSITGIVFIIINLTTAILPNEYLVPTIPFYILNIIPIVAVDILLSKLSTPKTKIVNYVAGAVIGSIFFTLYYPLITHTYNEVLPNSQTVWPSLTSSIYFKMIDKIYPLMVIPAAVIGIVATIVSSKLIPDKN